MAANGQREIPESRPLARDYPCPGEAIDMQLRCQREARLKHRQDPPGGIGGPESMHLPPKATARTRKTTQQKAIAPLVGEPIPPGKRHCPMPANPPGNQVPGITPAIRQKMRSPCGIFGNAHARLIKPISSRK